MFKKTPEKVNDPTIKEESIKPIQVEFNESSIFQISKEYNNISKDGSIELKLPSKNSYEFYLETLTVSVMGCSTQNVSYNIYYVPDSLNKPNTGYEIFQKKSRVEINKNSAPSLFVSLKNVVGCEKLILSVFIVKKPSVKSILGLWISNVISATDPYHKLNLDITQFYSNLNDLAKIEFTVSCGDFNVEKFTAEITDSNDLELPYKFVAKIISINSISSSNCSKQLGINYSQTNKKIFCIHNKELNQTNFNLACQLENESNKTFPNQYTDVTTNWSHN